MPKFEKNDRKPRSLGTALTLEQYDLLYAYIRHGVKPSRKTLSLAGMPRSSQSSISILARNSRERAAPICTFKRFKAVASRLEYRESDDQLIFTIGKRIALPSIRFFTVIREAHTSNGHKHLNLRCTIEKLSEKYAMGSRQYGITEENVRCVLQMCKDGSCGEKKKIDITVLKNFVQDDKRCKRKRKRSCTSNDKVKTSGEITTPQKSTKSETVSSLLKSKQSGKRSYVQILPLSSDLMTHDSTQTLHPYPIAGGVKWIPTSQNMMSQMMGSNMVSGANSIPYPIYPIQVVQAGSQPILPGQRIVFLDSNFLPLNPQQMQTTLFSPNGNSAETSAIDLSVTPKKTESNENIKLSNVSKDKTETVTFDADNNNNDISGDSAGLMGTSNLDLLNINPETELSALQELLYFSTLETKTLQKNKPAGGLQNTPEKCQNNKKDNCVDGSVSQKQSDVPSLPLLPHRDIWYCYDDINAETNAYRRACRCIKDMSLDVNKSMIGCWLSINRLRKKITYVQELISYLQDVKKEN